MHRFRGLSLHITEILFTQVNQHLMFYLASADDDHVLTEVICCMVINNHIASDLVDVVNVTQDRLAHHVFSVYVVVDILH